ncbi:nucleotide-binding universal stress UspA family protein [Streptomyces netropsis]|uniref:Nucleotide-binding universal stress UspA family protein n=2 Tax=Streptomyces netropsis TaxID=55404 RepID=A0A7W7PHH0_STRNE|nr:universal stress protein [Streptomyces netropsis]MBB4889248.1 nucleotide-binding universal stress UspA family protein [Streptomyces netropsis]GGR47012.1 stress-inducible protein [Streptomyces netropsis]
MDPVITVGLDGSPESRSAALWAAQEARLRGCTLRMLHAWILLSAAGEETTAESDRDYWSKKIVDDAQREVHRLYPELPVTEELVAEDPTPALLAAAAESDLLVLGSRGMGPIAAYFLGDVGLHVVAHTDTPVVLVRAQEDTAAQTPPPAADGEVVVGLNLQGPCDRLLEFAFAGAARRGATLHAVHAGKLPVQAYAPWGMDPDVVEDLTRDARKLLGDALRPWREKFPGVDVKESVHLESPARVITKAAAGAGLLVIGRRHKPRSGLGPHIGPVLQSALHHAPCPVAVAPHE